MDTLAASVLSSAANLFVFTAVWSLLSGENSCKPHTLLTVLSYFGAEALYNRMYMLWIDPHINLYDAEGLEPIELFYYCHYGIRWLLLLVCFWIGSQQHRFADAVGQAAITLGVSGVLYFLSASLIPPTLFDLSLSVTQILASALEILLMIGILFLARRVQVQKHYQRFKTGIHIVFILLSLWLTFGSVLTKLVFKQLHLGLYNSVNLLFFAPIFVLAALLLMIVIVIALRHAREHRQLQETQRHIEGLNTVLDESKKSIHDFNKHIRHLQSLVAVHAESGDFSTLEDEIDTYCSELLEHSEKDEMLLHLNDPTLRALLYGRRTQAKAGAVEFILDASPVLPHFPVKNYEMVEIFENLMDNAFDCVSALESKRFIRTVLECEPCEDGRCRHILCIQNAYDTLDIESILSGKRFTSKSGNHHGIGLSKVSKLVSDTGGKMILSHEDHIFSVKIIYEEAT